jgi:hypothetical protein
MYLLRTKYPRFPRFCSFERALLSINSLFSEPTYCWGSTPSGVAIRKAGLLTLQKFLQTTPQIIPGT